MKFIIEKEIFEKLPDLCVGVVVAKGVNNKKEYPEIDRMLQDSIVSAEQRFLNAKVKEDPRITPYREAFSKIGINPNKYQCSVEALFTRIAKGKKMPSINPLVDLNNAISLKHNLPMGTHDLGRSSLDTEMRHAKKGDTFRPMGSDVDETPNDGEVVYAVGNEIRTRRWAWRQSEFGKIDGDTSYVFFPIDGFVGINEKAVKKAADELREKLEAIFGAKTASGFVCRENPEFEWGLS